MTARCRLICAKPHAGGAKAGIAIGVVAAVALLAALLAFIVIKRRSATTPVDDDKCAPAVDYALHHKPAYFALRSLAK